MTALPAAASAAYQSIAKIGTDASAAARTQATAPGAANFTDFLSDAIKDGMQTMKAGEQMATQQVAGQANIVDVVTAVTESEVALETLVSVRDKVIAAYEEIMRMPI